MEYIDNQQPSEEVLILNNQIKTKEEFQKELNLRFPNNSIQILEYTKASGPIKYKCLDCGTEYNKNRANHLYENKTLCSKCYSGKTSQLREKFLSYNGTYFQLLDDPNKPINQKFHIRCLKCNREYDYKIQMSILNGFSCRYCGKNGSPVLQEEYEARLFKITDEFKVIKYKNITSSMTIQHKCGYIFSCLPTNFLKSANCPKCHSRRSAGEKRIANWLEKNKFDFEEQKQFKDLGAKKYDFFLPQFNLLIEYQGEQHVRPIEHFGGQEKFEMQRANDLLKKQYALQHGYQFLEIFYYDYNNIENILEGSTTKVG